MVQAINKIHSKNKIIPHTDECFYIYQNGAWMRAFSTNQSTPAPTYYKFFDTDVSTLNLNNFNINDYIITYKSITNNILCSETLNCENPEQKINGFSIWKVSGLHVLESGSVYKFPNTANNATKFETDQSVYVIKSNADVPQGVETKETKSSEIEHSINQIFYTKPGELYIASCYVKQVSSSTNNIAFQLFNDTYNIGITAKYNLNDATGYDLNGYKSVTCQYLNSDFNSADSNPVKNSFGNVSAGIYKIVNGEDIYYRLVIKCSCNFDSLMRVKFLILNNNSQYKYISGGSLAKYTIYLNAFQLEKYSDLNISKPAEYILSSAADKKPSTLKLLDVIYKVKINSSTSQRELVDEHNKLYYIHNIQEHTELIENSGFRTYLDSYEPYIENPRSGDIAVVPTLISFSYSTDNFYLISKNYGGEQGIVQAYKNANNDTPKNGQYVKVLSDERRGNKESIYQYVNGTWKYIPYDDSIIKFGDKFIVDNPAGTLNYDIIKSEYKIKDGNNGFKILSYKSTTKNNKAIVNSMIYNQGYFETWNKQPTGNTNKLGYNTGGGFNYNRFYNFFPDKR